MESPLFTLYPILREIPGSAELTGQWPILNSLEGTILFDERSPCRAFPLVLEGVIRVSKQSGQGKEIVLYRLYPGEGCIISLSCLIEHRAYTARAVADSALRMLMLPMEIFQRWQAESPPFQRYLMGLFSSRVDDLMQKVEEVAFLRLDARLAGNLLGHGTTIHKSHAQLANELNTAREIVSRHLKEFEGQGLVKLGREQIDILNAQALRKIAEGNQ